MKTLAFIIAIANSFLAPYVLVEVSVLFNIPFLVSFTYTQMFGLMFVISYFKLSLHLKDHKKEDDEETLRRALINVVMTFITWGLAYLYSFVL